MKKLISIIMVLAMILAMSTTAFADTRTTLTINGSEGRTYAGYQLLNLTTSLKQNHTNHDGEPHSKNCYNYAYTVNEKYRAILQAETFAKGDNAIWGDENKKPADATGVTDAQIMAHLNKQTSDSKDAYGSMRDVADRLYRAIKKAGIAADNNLTGNNDEIAQGYWIFADVTNLAGTDKANSLVMVDTAGQDPVVITPKTELPTIEKKVQDIDDSTDKDGIKNNAWQDSADHDMGDTVPFKLTATLPSNVKNYTSYALTFHDTLSDGLKINKDSVKVYMYDSKAKADADKELDNYVAVVTNNFSVTDGSTGCCTFEVSCENVLDIEGVTKDTAFVVYYTATLDKDDAVVGAAGNSNEVYLEFSNDPYSDGTGKTAPDKVKVFTYKVVINKTDAEGNALKGAGFTLYKKGTDGNYAAIGNELKGADMTTFTWVGLDDGYYKLVETTVPAGYNKMNDIEFTVSAEHSETADDPALIKLEGGNLSTGEFHSTGVIEEAIVNNTGTVLPETGAQGTFFLICGGSILVVLAAVFMITRKKMSVFEE